MADDPKILHGRCALVEARDTGRVLFEPKQTVGSRDLASWQAAAAGSPLLSHQVQDARTGWMKPNIGGWPAVLPRGDRVCHGTTGTADGLPLMPSRSWPI